MTSLLNLINLYGYNAIILLMVLENIFPPIPCELILTFSGFLTTFTNLKPLGVILFATLGSYIGAIGLYYIGKICSLEKINALLSKFHFDNKAFNQSVYLFNNYNHLIILIGRLIPIIRSIISIPAGICQMNFFNFSIYTIIGTLIWNSILVSLGIVLGRNWSMISTYLNRYSLVVFIFIIAIIIIKNRSYKS